MISSWFAIGQNFGGSEAGADCMQLSFSQEAHFGSVIMCSFRKVGGYYFPEKDQDRCGDGLTSSESETTAYG